MRHFLSIKDFTKSELLEMIDLSIKIKEEFKLNKTNHKYLKDKTLGMIFEKNSTRTRVSFEAGIYQLGGVGIFLSSADIQMSRGESVKDTSRVISRMLDMIMIRTFKQQTLIDFAQYSKVPIINGLTDLYHPVQVMSDYLTIKELNIKNPVVTYIGDGNNMANSWLILASKLGIEFKIATPKNYECKKEIIEDAFNFAKISGAKIEYFNNPKEAVKNSNVVITDTWISMGQEDDKNRRIKDFEGFMVNEELMNLAEKNAIVLHCLPAYKNYEISEETFEKYSDVIFLESENRLHFQKGLMVWLNSNIDK